MKRIIGALNTIYLRLKTIKNLAILISTISWVLGVFAEPMFEHFFPSLFDEKESLILVAYVLTSLAFISSVIWAASVHESNTKYSGSIERKIDLLSSKLGLSVTYVPIGRGNKDILFDDFREMIEKAEKEIFILTYHVVREINLGTPPYVTDARKAYYEAMHRKMEIKNRRNFRFRRIIQIPEGVNVADLDDPIFYKHMKKLAKIGEDFPEFASLKKCKPFTENTYILIDKRFLISQVAVINPNEGGAHYNGYFLIEDPSGLFMKDLLDFFDRIDARSVLVTPDEL